MGTRSLTKVFDASSGAAGEESAIVVNMYRQMDGYPSGHGKELAEFILSGTFVNGLGLGDKKVFNGCGCFAAQMVAHFKDGPGSIYLQPTASDDCGQDYEYHIHVPFETDKEPRIEVYDVGYPATNKTKLFTGTPKKFLAFCKRKEK